MPYTLRQKEAIAKQLTNAYTQGEAEILRKLANRNLSEWSAGYYNAQLKTIRAILAELDATAAAWAQLHIPGLYEDGARIVDSYLPALGDFTFTRLHAEAVELLQANITERLASATQRVGRQVADVYRRAGLEAIQQGLVQGETTREVSKRIVADLGKRGIEAFVDKRGTVWNLRTYADMVAQTTTMEAELQGTANRTLEAGMDLVKVSTHLDACEKCLPWQGKILSLTGATPGYPTLGEAREAGLLHPRCCPGDTRVLAPGASRGFRAWYDGPLVEVVLTNGARLAVTVHHQLLTPNGFAEAQTLREGDDLFYCAGFEGVVAKDPDTDGVPPRIDDVVGALAKAGGMTTCRVPLAAEDFHGDGGCMEGEIDVVAPDGLLEGAGVAAGEEQFGKQFLGAHDAQAASFAGSGDLAAILLALGTALGRPVGRLDHLLAPLGGLAFHSEADALGDGTDGDTCGDESAVDRGHATPEAGGDVLLGFSGEVAADNFGVIQGQAFRQGYAGNRQATSDGVDAALQAGGNALHGFTGAMPTNNLFPIQREAMRDVRDARLADESDDLSVADMESFGEILGSHALQVERRNILRVNVIHFAGHVYDLQTMSTLYVANGVLSSNCLHALTPYAPEVQG